MDLLKEKALRRDAASGNLEGIRQALAEGVAVDARDADGFTALHYAMKSYPHQEDKDHLAVVQLLVKSGADIQAAPSNGQTPLFEAAAEGLYDVVVYLHQHGATVNAALDTGANALFAIAEALEGRPRNVNVTIERDGQKVTLTDPDAIREAIGRHPDDEYNAYLNVVCYLIDQGIDLDARLAETQQTPLFSAASRGCDGMVAVLLEKGSLEVDDRDKWGLTALHYAARHGHAPVVARLVEAGAEVNARETYGFTPLHEAAEQGHLAVAKYLVKHGADPEAGLVRAYGSYPAGATPMKIAKAARRRNVARFLAGLDAEEADDKRPDDAATLRKIIAALNEVGSQLDQADHRSGYRPWEAIAEQEATIRALAKQLSEPFRHAHPDLVERLATCAHLEHGWGPLRDEVRGVLQSF